MIRSTLHTSDSIRPPGNSPVSLRSGSSYSRRVGSHAPSRREIQRLSWRLSNSIKKVGGMSGIRWAALSRPARPFFLPPHRVNRLWTRVSILLFVLLTLTCSFLCLIADVQQRPAPGPPKRPQQPSPATQRNSTTTPPVTPSSSRNAPSNRPGLDRSVSARTQPKTTNSAMSRSNTTKDARGAPDRHTPHHRQSQTQQSVNQHQPQTLPTPTKSKVIANAKPSPNSSSADLKTHHKPQQPALHKPGTGLNPPGAAPRRREKKEDDSDIIRRLQQICTDADPTRLYRNLVKIGAG